MLIVLAQQAALEQPHSCFSSSKVAGPSCGPKNVHRWRLFEAWALDAGTLLQSIRCPHSIMAGAHVAYWEFAQVQFRNWNDKHWGAYYHANLDIRGSSRIILGNPHVLTTPPPRFLFEEPDICLSRSYLRFYEAVQDSLRMHRRKLEALHPKR